MSPDDAREKLLDAILPNVPFDGWTHKALSAGAADLDLDPLELDRLFPGGPADVIECFSARADRQMLQGLGALELESMRVRDKVAAAVRLRLEALEPHREAVQRGLTFLGLPPNGALGLRCLYRTVDAVWHGIGDRSVDYNFYSKRATWAFLDRRIGEVLKIGGSFGKTFGRLLELPERIVAAGRRRC
jgi:ubiquinone biosynthesis protein COQ9